MAKQKPISEMNEQELRAFAVRAQRLMEEMCDLVICKVEGTAQEVRKLIGYVDGPYPELKHKDD